MMSDFKAQKEFSRALPRLLDFIHFRGFEVTLGDAWGEDGDGRHVSGSFHYRRLAIDLNLFTREGEYLTSTEAHRPFGEFWKSIGGTWGGDFPRKDGNHYSWGEGK